MATPAERIDDLDLHLNPPSKNPLDFLAGQVESKSEQEPLSGIHDFSEIKKPTEIGIDPAPIITTESGGAVVKESIEGSKASEEIFPLPKSLVDYINGLSENSRKRSLLHSMEGMPKDAIIRALNNHYARHYITEREYNTAFDLLNGLNKGEKKQDIGDLAWPPSEEDVEGVQMIEMEHQDTEGLKKNSEPPIAVEDTIQSVGEATGDLEEENTNIPLADSPDKKYEDQILKDIEEGYFGVARNSVENITDVERKALLIKLINEKEKEENVSTELSSSVEADAVGNRYELGDLAPDVVEKIETVKTSLDIARENYARAKIEFNKKNNKYNKMKGSLQSLLSWGILSGRSKEKSPTEVELDEAQRSLDGALAMYIKEKATKKDEIIDTFESKAQEKEGGGVTMTPEEEREMVGQIKIKLLEQAEREWDLLQGQMAELSSVESDKVNKIKEIATKGLKVWSKIPIGARLALAPILIGTGVGLTAGLGAGALYAGTRLGRGLGGAIGSRVAGSLYGKRADRINAEAKEEAASGYENLEKSFEEREVDYMKAKEEEVKRKNSQRIKKALVMVGAGAGAGILAGLAESALSSGSTVGATGSMETVNKPKAGSFDGVVRSKSTTSSITEPVLNKQDSLIHEIVNKPENIITPESIKTSTVVSATVELSPKGFLQDIHNLKANIIKQYGDNIPPEIKTNIIDKPTVEIAKEYGLYKPGDVNESAIGYAGEKLSIDSNGKLIIERVDGTKETLSGLGRDSVKAVVPEMDTNTSSAPTPEKLADIPVDAEVIQTKVIPDWDSRTAPMEHVTIPSEPEVTPTIDVSRPENLIHQVEHKGSLVDIVTQGEGKVVKIGDQIIGHDKVFGDSKILVLDDMYQDGAKYKDIRGAFAEAFEKSAKVDQIGQNPTAIDFEGGKIYIIQGLSNDPMGMKVLLNGKEIASGSMEVKGSVLGPKLKFDSNLKGGWFLDDNAYERAFKNVKKFLQIK